MGYPVSTYNYLAKKIMKRLDAVKLHGSTIEGWVTRKRNGNDKRLFGRDSMPYTLLFKGRVTDATTREEKLKIISEMMKELKVNSPEELFALQNKMQRGEKSTQKNLTGENKDKYGAFFTGVKRVTQLAMVIAFMKELGINSVNAMARVYSDIRKTKALIRICRKLGVRNTAELSKLLLKEKITKGNIGVVSEAKIALKMFKELGVSGVSDLNKLL